MMEVGGAISSIVKVCGATKSTLRKVSGDLIMFVVIEYFITQGMCQSSMFLTFRTIFNFRGRPWGLSRVGGGRGGGRGGIPGLHTYLLCYYEACFKI